MNRTPQRNNSHRTLSTCTRKILTKQGKACPIAEGVVDYARIVEILSHAGYDGYLEVEFVHGDDKLEALQRDRDYLASLIGSTTGDALKNLDIAPV